MFHFPKSTFFFLLLPNALNKMTRGDESGREERTKADKKYKEETFNTYTIFHLVSVTQFKHPPQPHSSYPFVLVIVPHLKYFPAARSVVNEGKTQTSKSETISFDVERISRFIFQRFSLPKHLSKKMLCKRAGIHIVFTWGIVSRALRFEISGNFERILKASKMQRGIYEK